jgi:hypothetical protein
LAAAHVICSSGVSFVSLFGEVATETGVSIGDFIAMGPAIIVCEGLKLRCPRFSNIFLKLFSFLSTWSSKLHFSATDNSHYNLNSIFGESSRGDRAGIETK